MKIRPTTGSYPVHCPLEVQISKSESRNLNLEIQNRVSPRHRIPSCTLSSRSLYISKSESRNLNLEIQMKIRLATGSHPVHCPLEILIQISESRNQNLDIQNGDTPVEWIRFCTLFSRNSNFQCIQLETPLASESHLQIVNVYKRSQVKLGQYSKHLKFYKLLLGN